MKRYFIDYNEDWPKRTDDLIDYPLVFPSAVVASVAFDVTGNFVFACEAHGEFACTSKACAPPPVGTGGSLPSGRSRSGGGGKRRTEFGKRIAKMIADDPELAAFSRERSDPVMRRRAAYAEYHARLREAISQPMGSEGRKALGSLVQISGSSDPKVIQHVLDLFKPEMLEPGYLAVPYSDEESAFIAVHTMLIDKTRDSFGGILFIDGKTVHFSLELDNAAVREMSQPLISTDRTLRSVMSVGRTVREEVARRFAEHPLLSDAGAAAERLRHGKEMAAMGEELKKKFPDMIIDLGGGKAWIDRSTGNVTVMSSAIKQGLFPTSQVERFLTQQVKKRGIKDFAEDIHVQFAQSDARRSLVLDTLKEVRSFGGKPSASPDPTITSATGQSKLLENLQKGADGIPSIWVNISNDHGVMSIRYTEGRAQYSNQWNEIQFGSNIDVVRHELAHRMEYVVPGLLGLEERFFKFRTGDNPKFTKLNELVDSTDRYWDNEVADPDQFFNPYVGKDYKGKAYEIMSMGVQHVFQHLTAKNTGTGLGEQLMDDDYIDFVLGTMLTVQWEA